MKILVEKGISNSIPYLFYSIDKAKKEAANRN